MRLGIELFPVAACYCFRNYIATAAKSREVLLRAGLGHLTIIGFLRRYPVQVGMRLRLATMMRPAFWALVGPRFSFYAFSAASSSNRVVALVKLSTPKTTSPTVEPGSSPQ